MAAKNNLLWRAFDSDSNRADIHTVILPLLLQDPAGSSQPMQQAYEVLPVEGELRVLAVWRGSNGKQCASRKFLVVWGLKIGIISTNPFLENGDGGSQQMMGVYGVGW